MESNQESNQAAKNTDQKLKEIKSSKNFKQLASSLDKEALEDNYFEDNYADSARLSYPKNSPADHNQKPDQKLEHSSSENPAAKSEEASWYYNQNIKGEGKKPDWFIEEKYKTIADQAKAYTELEKKLGQLKRAPDEYSFNYPPDYPEHLKLSLKDPLYQELVQTAKENNLSNEAFNSIFLEPSYENFKASEQIKQEEIAKLGEDGKERLAYISNWADNNLNQAQAETLRLYTQNSEMVELWEELIKRSSENKLPQTIDELKELNQDALNKRVADPRYKNDLEFRKKTSQMFEALYADDADELVF